MRVPSYNALLDLTQDPGLAMELRKVLTGEIDPLSYQAVERETDLWHTYPRNDDPHVILLACNHLLDLYGVEWAENKNHPAKSFFYLNTGDLYNATICYRPGGSIFVSCPADIIEQWRE